MNKLSLVIILTVIILTGCKTSHQTTSVNSVTAGNYFTGGKLYTSAYQQTAAEYRALCYQAYNAARIQISTYQPATPKPLAIITDIDETILDNSPFAVKQGLQNKEYNTIDWYAWTSLSNADTMPGAASFLSFVKNNNISVFYITNRDSVERLSTLRNLQKFNLPNADESHLLTRAGSSSKEARRQKIITDYEVVLYMGDNLGDLSAMFDKKNLQERSKAADELSAYFGNKFIVFPNPNYGDWEGAFLKYNYNQTTAQKDSVVKATLKAY